MKPVAKGQSYPDGTYVYTCGTCNGAGFVGDNHDCPDCYGLNVEKIVEQIQKGARGQRYYGLLKAFLSVRGKEIVSGFWTIKARDGKVTPVDIGYLSLKYGLNLKATWEWLEECRCVHSGMYEHFGSSGIKVRDVYEAAREKYPDLREIHAP